MIWGLFFGSIGLAYFVYGRKQSHLVAKYTGITLMVYPYFITNTIALVIVGVILLFLPKFLKI
ncbi:MAG: hypothetical protein ACI93R_002105 [Flavobacteriales bacterium]|jgi:hypothetical protein